MIVRLFELYFDRFLLKGKEEAIDQPESKDQGEPYAYGAILWPLSIRFDSRDEQPSETNEVRQKEHQVSIHSIGIQFTKCEK